MSLIIKWQDKCLKALADKADEYCLGGGTALAKVYFHHRFSFDLDFFPREFNRIKTVVLMESLSGALGKKIELAKEQADNNKVKIMVFEAALTKKESLRIDFIEDCIKRVKPPKAVDGIKVFSLEDIYLRKIYAVAGAVETVDITGRAISLGGRQEAKDFFDLYFLSYAFINLSEFAFKYCNSALQEAIIRWFRTYSRMDIKGGLLELKVKNKIDYRDMENHFKQEIGRLLEKQIGNL